MGGRGAASAAARANRNTLSWAEMEDLRRQMGQTGREATGYVQTSFSFTINAWMRGEISPSVDTTERIANTVVRMNQHMRPLPRDVQAVRFVDANFLSMFGLPPRITSSTVDGLRDFISQGGDGFTTDAFTSVSTDITRNVFTDRPIKLNVLLKKGAKAIITDNAAESEVVLKGNQKWTFTGARVQGGKLELGVTISAD